MRFDAEYAHYTTAFHLPQMIHWIGCTHLTIGFSARATDLMMAARQTGTERLVAYVGLSAHGKFGVGQK